MKKLFIFLLFFSYQLSSQIYLELAQDTSLSFEQIVNQTELYFDDKGRGKHTGYKQWKRWEYWTRRSLGSQGKIISNSRAYKEVNKFNKENSNPVKSAVGDWTEMGPLSATNSSTWSSHIGRISAIGLDINDAQHFIVGSPGGGVWQTTDEGNTWTPIFDNETILNVTSLEISHANDQHYFCGTYGLGVLKTIDGGATWTSTSGISVNTRIIRIIMDPTDSNVLLAVNEWGNIYRSSDGGDNWNIVYTSGPNIYDLEFKPGDSNVVYASAYGDVLKSTDNGVTFTTLTGPWATNAMMMAVTPDDPEYLYVLITDQGGFGALYLSTDSGATFTTQSDDSNNNNNIMGYNMDAKGGQAPRDMDVVVNPLDKTEVHVAGIMTFKSTNSGETWTQTTHWVISNPLPFVHADCDLMFYKNGNIYFGTDGGIFISPDGGTTFNDKTTGLGIRQFYRIGVSETDIDRVSGGSQDNGTGTVEAGAWTDWVGADGMETFIAKHDADIQYATIQYGGLYKTVNGGNSLASIANAPGAGDWVTPLEEDPIVNNVLYQGKEQLYKSINGGSSWSSISSFNPSNSGDISLVEVTVAPSNNEIIFAAYRHQMFRTTDGGTSWIDVSPTNSFLNVNYINVHPTDDQKVLIVLSGTAEKVMESIDQGTTWTDITATLPDIGAECAVYEGGVDDGIYVSMNPGVYYKSNSAPTWATYTSALPNVRVAELEIRNNFIYAATYGRGLWKNDLLVDFSCTISSITDLGESECNLNDGSYIRTLEIEYFGNPSSGTLDVNGGSFSITGSPQTVTFLNQPLDGATIDVTASFSADATCTLTAPALYTNPTTCPCTLNEANNQIVSCEGNGTASTADDTFTFSIDPSGNNTSTTYSVSGDITASNLQYGTVHVFDNGGGGFLVSDGNISIDIIDDSDPTCLLDIIIIAPANCSENFTCDKALIIPGPGAYTAIGPSQGNGGSNPGKHANWFSYTAPSDGLLSVYSCEMGVDTRLFLHDGNCTGINQLATSDDDCAITAGSSDLHASEILDYCLSSGITYYIEWDDEWSPAGFDFQVEFTSNTFYIDTDGDGFGDAGTSIIGCSAPAGYVANSTDCDDADANNYPGNTEVCDGADNNCNNQVDENLIIITYYQDSDEDGFGNSSVSLDDCAPPDGYVTNDTDCDDTDPNNYPGNPEVCDGSDNNCNSQVDENLITTYYQDSDEDGYGNSSISVQDCTAPSGYVTNATDCDDTDPNNYPGNTESCDGSDNNCNDLIDEPCGPCDDIYLVINPVNQDVNKAEINITSDASINSSTPIYFYAGTDIDLEPNFEVVLGTEFNAIIQPCTPIPAPGGDSEFYNIKTIEGLDEYFQKDQNAEQIIRTTLVDQGQNTVFEAIGKSEVIAKLRKFLALNSNKKFLLKLRFEK